MAAKKVAWASTVVMTLALTAVVLVGVWLGGTAVHGASIPIAEVYPVDSDTLLVAGTSGREADVDSRRVSRIALLEADGSLRAPVEEWGVTEVIGVTDELVWLRHGERGLHARRLADFGLVEGLQAGIDNHPVLSNRAQVQGFTAEGVVLLGADNARYLVDAAGGVRKLGEEEATLRRESRLAAEPDAEVTAAVRSWQARIAGIEELQSGVVATDPRTGAPLALGEDGVLATSLAFRVGGRMPTLHRVTGEGEVTWSLAAAEAIEAPADEGFADFLWVGLIEPEVVALVGHSEWERDRNQKEWATHRYALVHVDPASGAVTARLPVGEAE